MCTEPWYERAVRIAVSLIESSVPLSLRSRVREAIIESRPGLVPTHLCLYLLPVMLAGRGASLPMSWWAGLLYVTLPAGLLIYGVNDLFDQDVDLHNPRKLDEAAAWWFGSVRRPGRPALAWAELVVTHLAFAAVACATTAPWRLAVWFASFALTNVVYSVPPFQLSRIPIVAEISSATIYAHLYLLGAGLAGVQVETLPFLLVACTVLALHLSAELVDRDVDLLGGKRTLSVVMSIQQNRVVLMGIGVLKVLLWATVSEPFWATAAQCAPLAISWWQWRFRDWGWANTVYVAHVAADLTSMLVLAASI